MTETAGAGRGTLALVAGCIFAIVTSITMVGPLLVDISREFGVSLGTAGLLAAAPAVTQALGSPFAGVLSDRLGRRPLIVLSLAGIGAMGLAAGVAPTFAVLVAIRFVAGTLGALGPTSLMASVGDLFPLRRAQAMGWFNMGFSFAAIAGVPIAGAIGGLFGWRWAFTVIGIVLLALAIAMRLWFPSPPLAPSGIGMLAAYREVWTERGLVSLLSANLVERSLFMMTALYLPAFLMLGFAMNAVQVAPFLSLVAIGTIAGNLAGGWLGDRFPKAVVFCVSQLTAGVIGAVVFGAGLALPATVALAALFGVASATGRPSTLALSAEFAPRHRGAVFGLISFTNQSGLVLGASLGALLIEFGGYGLLAGVALAQGVLATALAIPLCLRRLA
jgi:predicted MFS family arabinose efflux permease